MRRNAALLVALLAACAPAAPGTAPTPVPALLAAAATVPVDLQLEAYNRGDLEAFLAPYAPDARIHRFPGETILTGVEAMRLSYGRLFASAPQLRATVTARIVEGDFVFDHERVTGLPDGSELHTVAVYEVREGLIRNVWLLR